MPDLGRQAASHLRLMVIATDAGDAATRLETVAALLTKRRGIRTELTAGTLRLSVDPGRIEQLGPAIEAAVAAHKLILRIEDLDADVPSGDLDSRPSRLWAAIGNAALDIEVARDRGDDLVSDLFSYLRVEEVDGHREVRDDRAPLVDPIDNGPPSDFGPTKYDDIDYHDGAAVGAGQPRENAFTHMGFYLAWLIQHDLHDRRWFTREHVAAVQRGEMTGSDLADLTDGKLLSDLMTAEGSDFSDARYDAYVEAYGRVFADEPDYAVLDDAKNYARIAPAIDALYSAWVADGRPPPQPKALSQWDAQVEAAYEAADIVWEDIATHADGPMPHEAPELEALVPDDLLDPPISAMSSVTASAWGSSLLNRALKRLGMRPRDARVASGIGGHGGRTLTIILYGVPGATAELLTDEFATVIYRPPKAKWQPRQVAGRTVMWAKGRVDDMQLTIAYWARDGLVMHVAGEPADIEAAIPRLP